MRDIRYEIQLIRDKLIATESPFDNAISSLLNGVAELHYLGHKVLADECGYDSGDFDAALKEIGMAQAYFKAVNQQIAKGTGDSQPSGG